MSIVSQQIGWSEESKLLWYILQETRRTGQNIYKSNSQNLQQVLANGDRPIKDILVDFDPDSGTYHYDFEIEDNTKALFIGSDGIVFGASSFITLNETIPIGGEIVIYNTRSLVFINIGSYSMITNGMGTYQIQTYTTCKIKRIDANTFHIEEDFGPNKENNTNKQNIYDIDVNAGGANDIYYPSVNGLLDYTGRLFSGLKPILINDPYQEYFSDLESALTCISNFTFSFPVYAFYNLDSRKLYLWYTIDYLQSINIGVNLISGDPICYGNNVNIQDESGFIQSISGMAFRKNYYQYLTSIDNIFKQVFFPDDLPLSISDTNFKLGNVFSNGINFCGNGSTGNIEINNAYFYKDNAFNAYSPQGSNKLTIKNLWLIDTNFCNSISDARVELLYIDSGITFDVNSFTTTAVVALHIPAKDVSLTSANYIQLLANITNPDSVIIRE